MIFPEPKYSELFVWSCAIIFGSIFFFMFRFYWHTGETTVATVYQINEYTGKNAHIAARYKFKLDKTEHLGSIRYSPLFYSKNEIAKLWPIGKEVEITYMPTNPIINRPLSEVNYDLPILVLSFGIALMRIYFIITAPPKRRHRSS